MTTQKKVKIKPLGDRILLRPIISSDKKTKSGIIIPDTIGKEVPEQGEVVAVGEGALMDGKRIKPSVEVGDTVVFSKYGYDEIKVNGEEFFILKEENILAIID
jgi:chaperonin GroES